MELMADYTKQQVVPFCDDDDKDDSFVIDMDNFPNNSNTKDAAPNSKFTRTLSRKGSHRIGSGSEKKLNGIPAAAAIDTSAAVSKGSNMPEKAVVMPKVVGPDFIDSNKQTQVHQQITSSNVAANSTSWESRFGFRRNGLKRPAYLCAVDPKRVLLFFATLSSMGTLLLIYFTLFIGKVYVNDQALE
ncbi:hypothetical protein ACFE04_003528 [Oxalis oulophora]